MTVTSQTTETETKGQTCQLLFHDQFNKIIEPVLPQFDRLIRTEVFFNCIFFFVIAIEIVLLFLFFTFLAQSSLLAFGLGLLFLTLFSYFMIRLNFHDAKWEKMKGLRERFINGCKTLISYQEGNVEHHIAISNACCRLSENLVGREYSYYRPPKSLIFLAPMMEKFSFCWHWQDIHRMREMLLLAVVEEYLKLVRCEPTSLYTHTHLANSYVNLSRHYADPSHWIKNNGSRLLSSESYRSELEVKFRDTAKKAIEEFKILRDYSPSNSWIHLQLAYCYHELHMPLEEISEYETALDINPHDKDALYNLGTLYFQQGWNAKGLHVYEELRRCNYTKAENLIKFYGC